MKVFKGWWVSNIGPWGSETTATLVLLIAAITVYIIVKHAINVFTEQNILARRKWRVNARNAILALTIFLLFGIWMVELKTFALSVGVLVTATVVAFKEPISCVVGALVTATKRSYSLGDRIEVNGHNGEVLDKTFMTTTLLENGGTNQNRGVVITIPNHWFLSHSVRNFSKLGKYRIGDLTLNIPSNVNPMLHKKWLELAANNAVESFREEAAQTLSSLKEEHGVRWPSAEPKVVVVPVDGKTTELVVRYPSLSGREMGIGQLIIERYWELRSEYEESNPPPQSRDD